MEKIKLSIITINLNNAAGLEKTIGSVRSQSFRNLEHIVIDGGSKDGSLEIIKRASDQIAYWISESDRGVYHAMNKGIRAAKGEYCYFLNSGDYLHDAQALALLGTDSISADIVNFDALVDDGREQIKVSAAKTISFRQFYTGSLLHQATLIKKDLFTRLGPYNENLKMLSDWEFFVKALFLHHCTYQAVPQLLAVFEANGYSSKPENYESGLLERKQLLEQHFSRFLPDYRLLSGPAYGYLEVVHHYPFLKALFTFKARLINRLFRSVSRGE